LQRAAASISIRRPPEAIFGLLAPDRMVQWYGLEEKPRVQRATADTPAAGVRYFLVQRLMWSEVPIEVEILDYEPPSLLRSRASNDHFEGVLTVLLKTEDSTTHVQMTEEFTARGGLGKLLESVFARQAQSRAEQALQRLKQLVENGQ
jgi:uncharacterized protein YndB with AHSA1/START domain